MMVNMLVEVEQELHQKCISENLENEDGEYGDGIELQTEIDDNVYDGIEIHL
jgi:hypothetical protein